MLPKHSQIHILRKPMLFLALHDNINAGRISTMLVEYLHLTKYLLEIMRLLNNCILHNKLRIKVEKTTNHYKQKKLFAFVAVFINVNVFMTIFNGVKNYAILVLLSALAYAYKIKLKYQ